MLHVFLFQGSQQLILPTIFPFTLMQDDSTEEGQLYKKMKNALTRIKQKSYRKRLLALASDWYAASDTLKVLFPNSVTSFVCSVKYITLCFNN